MATEQDYIDICNHSKEIYEIQEKRIEELNNMIINLKKQVIIGYSLIRIIDDLFDDDDNNLLQELIELLRGQMSDFIEGFI